MDLGSRCHRNVFESNSVLSLYKRVALSKGDFRCAMISDFAVVVGAHSRKGTTLIAGGVYPSISFGPTRWNPSDDSTRGAETCRSPVAGLSRRRANWVWLALLLYKVSPGHQLSALRAFPSGSPFAAIRAATWISTPLLDFPVKALLSLWPASFS